MRQYVLVVAAGFLVIVYQSLYDEMARVEDTPFTGKSTALINLVGILAVGLMSMGGSFAIHWARTYSSQAVIIAGGWVFCIACLTGIGTCLTYAPTMGVAPTWFDKRRGFAMGVIISESAVGGFQEQFRLQTQGLRRRSGWMQAPMVNYRVARSKRFATQALGCFLQSAGYSTPLFFYAATDGLFIVFMILYGTFVSAYISLFPDSLIDPCVVQHFTSVNGAHYMIRGMGTLIGTPPMAMLIPKSGALTFSYIYEREGFLIGASLTAATMACLWKWRV
ncbi:hypothetical protein BDV12DRAFT_190502 [Aspergillus spectabilis]